MLMATVLRMTGTMDAPYTAQASGFFGTRPGAPKDRPKIPRCGSIRLQAQQLRQRIIERHQGLGGWTGCSHA